MNADHQTLGETHPVVVADADGVGSLEELVLLSFDQIVQSLASRLLHALETHLEVDGEVESKLFVSLNDVDPSKDLRMRAGGRDQTRRQRAEKTRQAHRSLVVRGSTSDESTVSVLGEDEWLSLPSV